MEGKEETLQGKDPLVEVITKVFSVVKLPKIVKKTFATTSFFRNGGFGRASNRISTQLKKLGSRMMLQMFFSSVRASGVNTPMRCTVNAPVL